jgi:hypothetical protein
MSSVTFRQVFAAGSQPENISIFIFFQLCEKIQAVSSLLDGERPPDKNPDKNRFETNSHH